MTARHEAQWKPVEDAHLRCLWQAGWRGDERLALAMAEIGYRRTAAAILYRRHCLDLVDSTDTRARPPQTGVCIETPRRMPRWSDPLDPTELASANSQLVQAITLYQLKQASPARMNP